mmetsp:Transcript_12527/g.21007  ORF Transcript_12527/g.21007 Transcript_12527/m.21007 type:complete len:181 (-) Transcript_12527:262-804(-)
MLVAQYVRYFQDTILKQQLQQQHEEQQPQPPQQHHPSPHQQLLKSEQLLQSQQLLHQQHQYQRPHPHPHPHPLVRNPVPCSEQSTSPWLPIFDALQQQTPVAVQCIETVKRLNLPISPMSLLQSAIPMPFCNFVADMSNEDLIDIFAQELPELRYTMQAAPGNGIPAAEPAWQMPLQSCW